MHSPPHPKPNPHQICLRFISPYPSSWLSDDKSKISHPPALKKLKSLGNESNWISPHKKILMSSGWFLRIYFRKIIGFFSELDSFIRDTPNKALWSRAILIVRHSQCHCTSREVTNCCRQYTSNLEMKCVTAIVSMLDCRYCAKPILNILVFPCCIPTHPRCFITLNTKKDQKVDNIFKRLDIYVRFFCINQWKTTYRWKYRKYPSHT